MDKINYEMQKEYDCIMFESIRERIIEKAIFINIRKINIIKRIQANPV